MSGRALRAILFWEREEENSKEENVRARSARHPFFCFRKGRKKEEERKCLVAAARHPFSFLGREKRKGEKGGERRKKKIRVAAARHPFSFRKKKMSGDCCAPPAPPLG
jgi:hypothetical protein